jgi:hypothetical protein
MTEPHAQGGNYRIDIADGVATCRVWRRPDVDAQTGAGWAAEQLEVVQRLAAEPATSVRGFILDLQDAPPVVGPRTEAAIGQMLAPWETRGRPVVVIPGASPTQRLQLTRVVRLHAPTWGRVEVDGAAATAAMTRGASAG